MAILNGINGSRGALNVFANALGINGWQLQDAKYNGCSFLVFTEIPILQNSLLYKEDVNLVAAINQSQGQIGSDDPNSIGALVDTVLASIQFEDILNRGIVVKDLPFAGEVSIEDLRNRGWTFKMSVLFLGQDYQKALTNFENAINNPPIGDDRYKLIHPIRGAITGNTYVQDYSVVSNVSNWRAAMINIVFRSEQSSIANPQGTISSTQTVVNLLQSGLGAVAGLASATATVGVVIDGVIPAVKANNFMVKAINPTIPLYRPIKFNALTTINNILNNLSVTLFNCINYVYKKGNTGATISELDSVEIDYTYLPPSVNKTLAFTLSQVPILLGFYNQLTISAINTINSFNFGVIMNDTINKINAGQASLINLCLKVKASNQYSTYVVPYEMSMRRILANNNLSLSLLPDANAINPQIQSGNRVPAGIIVNLP